MAAVTIDTPSPISIGGTVTGTYVSNQPLAPILSYQVNNGPMKAISFLGSSSWNFGITSADFPMPGSYLLSVYIADPNQPPSNPPASSVSQYFTIT